MDEKASEANKASEYLREVYDECDKQRAAKEAAEERLKALDRDMEDLKRDHDRKMNAKQRDLSRQEQIASELKLQVDKLHSQLVDALSATSATPSSITDQLRELYDQRDQQKALRERAEFKARELEARLAAFTGGTSPRGAATNL